MSKGPANAQVLRITPGNHTNAPPQPRHAQTTNAKQRYKSVYVQAKSIACDRIADD
jgi:hypothetical protein